MEDSHGLTAYVQKLRVLTARVDPTLPSSEAEAIRSYASSLEALGQISQQSLTDWAGANPEGVYTLALVVGLSREKLRSHLRAQFGVQSWAKAARIDPSGVVKWLSEQFGLVELLEAQRGKTYRMGDVLVARGTTRQTASSAGAAGLLIEDSVEAIVRELGLDYQMRGRFIGRNKETAPADISVPTFNDCVIAIACKGFDSTGSKLTAAVQEVIDMSNVRYSHQYVMAVVDGIGWLGRMGDFRRMYNLLVTRRIDGLYSLADLSQFREDLTEAARRHKLMP